MKRFIFVTIWMGLALCLCGGCASMRAGDVEWIQTSSDKPYAGNVYLLRGFIGIWSYGIDHLGDKINEAGVRAAVFQEDQWTNVRDRIIEVYKNNPNHEPIVLVGHSYGADDVVRIARDLKDQNIEIDLVITLDPVTPPSVPSNIKLCYNIYQSNFLDALPFFRGVPLAPDSENQMNLKNVNIRENRQDLLEPGTDHFNIEKNERIHGEVLAKIKEFCPRRSDWAMRASTGLRAGAP